VAVFIAGHTDWIGSEEYNLQLGLRRARSVASALAELGVAQAQIFAISFGKAVPIADNNTPEGREKNRRVEFLFSARPQAIAAYLSGLHAQSCMAQGATDNCPKSLAFRAESVELESEPKTQGSIESDAKSQVPIGPYEKPKQIVVIGRKTVDIDLTQHVWVLKYQ
jgi:hypothetical protein